MPDQTEIKLLLRKLFDNEQLSKEELKKIYKALNRESDLEATQEWLNEKWEQSDFNEISPKSSSRILADIKKQIENRTPRKIRLHQNVFKWTSAAAAAILIALIISLSFFFDVRLKNDHLVLLQEITAPNGHIEKLTLPDGTKVWLNPGSSIIYKSDFTNQSIRDIRLWGQAYFQVAKDPSKPFILEMGDIGLKVLGTTFNACNYKEDQTISVALKEGKVSLFEGAYENASQYTELNPGQIAEYTKGHNGFDIQNIDVNRITSWINGVLTFRDESMSTVFRQLERWYNVKILVSDAEINDYLFTATIKTESLTQILKLLEFTSPIEYEVLDNSGYQNYKPTILIKPKQN